MKKFLILLGSLSESTPLMQIIKLRNTPYSEIKDSKIKEIKRRFTLKQSEEEKEDALKTFANFIANRKE